MKKIYISGKMTGIPRQTYKANFGEAEERLKGLGYDVVNPAGIIPYIIYLLFGYYAVLAYDLKQLSKCDAIYLTYGFKHSKGSNIERIVAMLDKQTILNQSMSDDSIKRIMK